MHSDHTLTPTTHPPLAYLLTTFYLLLLTSYSRLTRYLAAHNNMVEVHKSCRAVHSEDDAKARATCNPTRCGLQPRVREHATPCKGICHPVCGRMPACARRALLGLITHSLTFLLIFLTLLLT